MTDEDDNAGRGAREDELARVARELAALGEPELEDDVEPALSLGMSAALTSEAAVLAAFALAYPRTAASGPIGVAELSPLSELDRHRVWRRVQPRVGAGHEDHARPASSWRATWVAVAMAAGVALVPVLAPPSSGSTTTTPASRAATEALGEQARAALEGVPGTQDGARASELAAKYAARLDGAEGER
jgi:hypothetical protein